MQIRTICMVSDAHVETVIGNTGSYFPYTWSVSSTPRRIFHAPIPFMENTIDYSMGDGSSHYTFAVFWKYQYECCERIILRIPPRCREKTYFSVLSKPRESVWDTLAGIIIFQNASECMEMKLVLKVRRINEWSVPGTLLVLAHARMRSKNSLVYRKHQITYRESTKRVFQLRKHSSSLYCARFCLWV